MIGHLAPHHQIGNSQDGACLIVEKGIVHRHRRTCRSEPFGGGARRFSLAKRGTGHRPRIVMHRPGYRLAFRITGKHQIKNRLPAPEPDIDMRDGGQISLQRHHHMRCRTFDQHIIKKIHHHRRSARCIRQIPHLHAGKYQHVRVMTEQRPVEGRMGQAGSERIVGGNRAATASQGTAEITNKGVDMGRHMLEVASIAWCQAFQSPRRGQRPFGARRHLIDMNVVMQKPDMVRACMDKRPVQRGMHQLCPAGRIGCAGVDIIDGPGGQHDLRIDIEGSDIRVVAKTVIDRHHRVRIGAFPDSKTIIFGRNLRRRKSLCQRVNQPPHDGRGVFTPL